MDEGVQCYLYLFDLQTHPYGCWLTLTSSNPPCVFNVQDSNCKHRWCNSISGKEHDTMTETLIFLGVNTLWNQTSTLTLLSYECRSARLELWTWAGVSQTSRSVLSRLLRCILLLNDVRRLFFPHQILNMLWSEAGSACSLWPGSLFWRSAWSGSRRRKTAQVRWWSHFLSLL